jgi:hypothetical protein
MRSRFLQFGLNELEQCLSDISHNIPFKAVFAWHDEASDLQLCYCHWTFSKIVFMYFFLLGPFTDVIYGFS